MKCEVKCDKLNFEVLFKHYASGSTQNRDVRASGIGSCIKKLKFLVMKVTMVILCMMFS